ncbi:MAG: Fic family protein [Anaerolineae bacterium]|nr:Fic family protein [Anaerolineae bacterium]
MRPDSFTKNAPGKVIQAQKGYWTYLPDPLPPQLSWTEDLVAALSQADLALGELAGLGRTLLNPHLLIRPFMHQEAVVSSRIEGTQASLSDLFRYEAGQLTLFEERSDVREVHNYVRAMEYGLERLKELPVSLRLIRELHGLLMEGVRGEGKKPGEFRDSYNWIGPPNCTVKTARYVPPPVSHMHDALHALEEFLHSPSEMPPLVRLALIHYQFEAIHPFLDGNGRIGRLLMSLLACAWNLLPQPLLYLSAYFEAHRDDYYDLLLAVSRRGVWEEWVTFFLRGVKEQCGDAVARIKHLQDLRGYYRVQVQRTHASARLLDVVDMLFLNPVLTVRRVEGEVGVTFQTAQRYVDWLVELGILMEVTGKGRNRLYAARDVILAVEAPGGEGSG